MPNEIPSLNPEKIYQPSQPKSPPKSAEQLLQEATDRKKTEQAGESEGKLIKFFEECTEKDGDDIDQNICLLVKSIDPNNMLTLMLLADMVGEATHGQIDSFTSQKLTTILNTCENPHTQAEKVLETLIPLLSSDRQKIFLEIPDLPDNWRKIIAKEMSDSKK